MGHWYLPLMLNMLPLCPVIISVLLNINQLSFTNTTNHTITMITTITRAITCSHHTAPSRNQQGHLLRRINSRWVWRAQGAYVFDERFWDGLTEKVDGPHLACSTITTITPYRHYHHCHHHHHYVITFIGITTPWIFHTPMSGCERFFGSVSITSSLLPMWHRVSS